MGPPRMHSSPSSSLYSQLRSGIAPRWSGTLPSCGVHSRPSPQVSVMPYIWATKSPSPSYHSESWGRTWQRRRSARTGRSGWSRRPRLHHVAVDALQQHRRTAITSLCMAQIPVEILQVVAQVDGWPVMPTKQGWSWRRCGTWAGADRDENSSVFQPVYFFTSSKGSMKSRHGAEQVLLAQHDTPLLRPVVPEVNMIKARARGPPPRSTSSSGS